ncbi:conserved hypothetical protein [Halorhabdus utahensis DSM 12940]|uniref:Uncharacterized protein n=1 Tax=Halorhabdus utahensis (strain DSM 12940 / JCM 11049 / AX-2) TaxID=519442 RepID=C7NQ05_HALUD|nr:hypothetical protein [Halorhabdus utahensis]ACV11749.1 conserved hypothetical protein [Halorhabdus utahensis DSM 12940]
MLGTTLEEIRSHIESLASEDGPYYLVCARYGDRPVPTTGLRFRTRAEARTAARATEQYRAALRRYDPRLPRYDVIVCQRSLRVTPGSTGRGSEPGGSTSRTDQARPPEDDQGADGEPRSEPSDVDPWSGSNHGPGSRVEFCHRVAGAVFEALSDCGHDAVESAVMDAYFELAERVGDLDDLCVCLLESMAGEIDRGLSADEQATVIDTAVSRLPGPASTDHPVEATLASLESRELLKEFTWSPATEGHDPRAVDVVVGLSGYALSPRDGRLPVLPVVVELVRHEPSKRVASLRVADLEDGWRIRLRLARSATSDELVTAHIRSEG